MRVTLLFLSLVASLAAASKLIARDSQGYGCPSCVEGYLVCSNGQQCMCYNPAKGDICCNDGMVYPAGSQCANDGQFHTLTRTVLSNKTATVTVPPHNTDTAFIPVSPATSGSNGGYGVVSSPIITMTPIGSVIANTPTTAIDLSSGIVPPYVLSSIASANDATTSQVQSTSTGSANSGAPTSLPSSATHVASVGPTSSTSPSPSVAGFTNNAAVTCKTALFLGLAVHMVYVSAPLVF